MATAAVIGLAAGKRLLSTSFYPSDLTEKWLSVQDHGVGPHCAVSTRSHIVAKKDLNLGKGYSSNRQIQALRALKEHVDTTSPSTADLWFQESTISEEGDYDLESSLEAFLLLQKSMLEKQWNLSFYQAWTRVTSREGPNKAKITRSGLTARERRNKTRTNCTNKSTYLLPIGRRKRSIVSPELVRSHSKGYLWGSVNEDLLSHAEVIHLSQKIKTGLFLEGQKKRLEIKLGCEPSDKQLASSLRISHTELHSKLIDCSLAREKLAMSNVRLVISIAQKYDNLGAEMADLIQGGLIGLLRGIEKFDSSKGFRISTYVYWWIRQGVSKALVENSRTLRLPSHLHVRLSSIRAAKAKLEEKGVAPSVDKIAKILNISKKKVWNATEANNKLLSLDREAFPALNGLPAETFHSYIADTHLENSPWHGYDEWSLKDEVNKLLDTTLGERERDIVRLYYGLEKECHTWEEISRQFGLSRERVRQVGLVALEKLKLAARKKRLEAMLVKH